MLTPSFSLPGPHDLKPLVITISQVAPRPGMLGHLGKCRTPLVTAGTRQEGRWPPEEASEPGPIGMCGDAKAPAEGSQSPRECWFLEQWGFIFEQEPGWQPGRVPQKPQQMCW